MAEVLVAVGAVASIVQLVDFGHRAVRRLNEYQSAFGALPETFRGIKTELPLLLHVLEQTKEVIDKGQIGEQTIEALDPVVVACKEQVEQLDNIFEAILPTGNSWREKTKKGVKSLALESKVERIEAALGRYIQVLTYYHAAASSTLRPSTGIFPFHSKSAVCRPSLARKM
jgi:hypothetical protein